VSGPEQPAAPPPNLHAQETFTRQDGSIGHPFQKTNYLPSIILWVLLMLFLMVRELRSSQWISFGDSILLSFFLIPWIQLLLRKPKFLASWHIVFIITAFVEFGLGCLFVWADKSALYFVAFGIALNAAVFFLMRLYFTRSVRVRTYMGTDAYITQCLFTRKVKPPQPAVPDQ
jgi:hypothetical protein